MLFFTFSNISLLLPTTMKSICLPLLFTLFLISAARPDPSSQEGPPGYSYNVPGFGPVPIIGGGYGGGYGGPGGGGSSHGVTRPIITCSDKGPCYKKKLQCPAKCFTSYGGSGNGFGFGGGGGGCTMDCKRKCVAYC